jgi:hypothetical protein
MSFILLQSAKGGQLTKILLLASTPVMVLPDAHYTVIDDTAGKSPQYLRLHKDGDDLIITASGEKITAIENFFAHATNATFATDGSTLAAQTASGSLIHSSADASTIDMDAHSDRVWESHTPDAQTAPLFIANSLLIVGGVVAGGVALGALSSSGSSTTAPVSTDSDSTPVDSTAGHSGFVADGYIQGAQLYADTNGDGIADASELISGVVTNAEGVFTLPVDFVNTPLLALGGFNIDTGLPNTVVLSTPAGALVVNPLTTIVQHYLLAHPDKTRDDAEAAVQKALGIVLPEGATPTTYDPIAQKDVAAQKIAAQIVEIAAQAEATTPGSGTTVFTNLAALVETANTNVTPLALSDVTVVTRATAGIAGLDEEVNAAIASQNGKIDSGTQISDISEQQKAPIVSLTDDTGASQTDLVTRVGTLEVTGKLPDATLEYSISGGTSWTTSFTAKEGINTVDVRQVNAAGSQVSDITSLTFTYDTSKPSAPQVASTTAGSEINAAEATAGIIIAATLAGTGTVAGDSIELLSGASPYSAPKKHTLTAEDIDEGNVSFTLSKAELGKEGSQALTTRITDVAGNVDPGSPALEITLDTVFPTTPIINTVSDDNITNAAENSEGFNLTGTGEIGATVTVTGATLATGNTAVVNAEGHWSLAVAANELTANAVNNLSATQTDVAGNASTAGTTTLTTDTLVSAPTFDTISTDNLINVAENIGGFDLTGTGEIGATVTVKGATFAGGQSAVVAGNGTWTLAVLANELAANALNNLSAMQTDIAGNVSNAAASAVTTDYVAAAPVINTVSTDNVINAAENSAGFNLTGTGEVGATVTVIGATFAGSQTVVVAANGTWTLAVAANELTANAVNNISATQTDLAGNVSSASPTLALILDTLASTTTISAIAISDDTGTNNTDFYTQPAVQTITGTLSAGLVDGEVLYGSVDGGATWMDVTEKVNGTAISWNDATLAGTSSIQLKVTNPASNNGTVAIQEYELAPEAALAVVVFDMAHGVNSGHSGRVFNVDVEYMIYVLVDYYNPSFNKPANGSRLDATWGDWSGGENLGSDDVVVLVGMGGMIDLFTDHQYGLWNPISDGANWKVRDNGGNEFLKYRESIYRSEVQPYKDGGGRFYSNIVETVGLLSGVLYKQHDNHIRGFYTRYPTWTSHDVRMYEKRTLWTGTNVHRQYADIMDDHYLQAMPTHILTTQGLV